MAWNEPGGNDKDPWGKNDQGPPDLDEVFKNFNKWVNGLFGGSGNSDNGGGIAAFGVLVLVALIGWAAMGLYEVDEQERAVVLRLGKFHQQVGPGLHWAPPIIDKREIVSVTNEREYTSRGLMLTEDENIVEMPLTVQYNISDVKAFVLNVRDPINALQHATDSALRHVIGSSTLDKVLSDGRQKIAVEVKERLQTYLNGYETGIQIVNINLQRAEPPKEVKAAFDDVTEAKEDRERFKNEAQAYANEIVPIARGKAQRMIEEASAYKAQVIAEATGDADRFENLVAEYKKAPGVTRERLYIDSVERVMSNSTKVLVDVESGNNMFYMPLDKIVTDMNRSAGTPTLSQSDIDQISRRVIENINSVRRNTTNTTRTGGR